MGGGDGVPKNDLVAMVRAVVVEDRKSAVSEASELVEGFWDEHWAGHNHGRPETRGYLGVRVRRRGQGMGIEWFKTSPAFRKKGSNGPTKPFHRYLARGKGYEYPLSVFRKAGAKAWELEQIRVLEPQFGEMRRRMEMLAKMDRQAREYECTGGLPNPGTVENRDQVPHRKIRSMQRTLDGNEYWIEVFEACRLGEQGERLDAFLRDPLTALRRHGQESALECLAKGFRPLLPRQAAVARRLAQVWGREVPAGTGGQSRGAASSLEHVWPMDGVAVGRQPFATHRRLS
jgi:hypothetical protein